MYSELFEKFVLGIILSVFFFLFNSKKFSFLFKFSIPLTLLLLRSKISLF